MNSESLQISENSQQRDATSEQTQPSEDLEFDSLIITARNDGLNPLPEGITEPTQLEKGTQSPQTLKDANQNEIGLNREQLAEAISYLSKNPRSEIICIYHTTLVDSSHAYRYPILI
jgi:hypothetical protein